LPRVHFALTRTDGAETSGSGELTIDDAVIVLHPEAGAPFTASHESVVAIRSADHEATFDLDDGARLHISQAGLMLGDIVKQAREARAEAWEKGLFLHGVRLVDTFAAELQSGGGTEPVQVRMYEDRLSVLPEGGAPFGLPYALAREVVFDAQSYRVSVIAGDGALVFGKLKLRSTEFAGLLTDLIAASRARTALALAEHLPGISATALTGISNLMGDGIAARREDIESLAPRAWARLEGLVISSDLRPSYEYLASMSSTPDTAFGIKQARGTGEENPEDATTQAVGNEGGGPTLVTWFFCPIPRGDGGFVAQEITSEQDHATYFFRIAGQDWKAALDGLNRAMLALNFKRRPIYEGGEDGGPHAFAVRHLPYLRELRASFAGRAIHTSHEAWRASVDGILSG
jgi:hypothetical protein